MQKKLRGKSPKNEANNENNSVRKWEEIPQGQWSMDPKRW